ncbi:DUF5994 family protein [Phytohabitans sp. LJ34]|uniref:DUF5994 family protein n=1 Tax=Phytohabitans sp. LJ34 TaxID=3452217 RepID=UPI003F8B921B
MSATTAAERMIITSLAPPSTPRLRLESTGSRRTLLDGAWWPRSTDPVAELPGLVLALDKVRGPVNRLVLAAAGWDSHPRRLGVAGRVLRLGYFTSQPVSLLTAIGDNDRIDLLVVPPNTADGMADAAMVLAATTTNLVHAQHIMLAVSIPTTRPIDGTAEDAWEAEGGHGRPVPSPAQ